jgi:hypothetical protein
MENYIKNDKILLKLYEYINDNNLEEEDIVCISQTIVCDENFLYYEISFKNNQTISIKSDGTIINRLKESSESIHWNSFISTYKDNIKESSESIHWNSFISTYKDNISDNSLKQILEAFYYYIKEGVYSKKTNKIMKNE